MVSTGISRGMPCGVVAGIMQLRGDNNNQKKAGKIMERGRIDTESEILGILRKESHGERLTAVEQLKLVFGDPDGRIRKAYEGRG